MKKILIIACMLLSLKSIAQNRGVSYTFSPPSEGSTGKTYALIIGISKYEDKTMPQLQFADSDAVNFYRFLRSKTGGNADSANIRLLVNKNARSTDVWRELQWIMRRADTSDKVYIYFSGHGDGGNNSEDVYLLTHETARVDDAGLYVPTSALPVMNLKTKIKTLLHKNVEVLLITDACRTNELPGKAGGSEMIYHNVMDENITSSQIQIASCKANQESQESKKWGNGRGVFSFYLINGLYGQADNEPMDGKVTLEELETYVKDNVKRDTRSLSTGEPLQVPVFKGSNKTLCKVDPVEKQAVMFASVGGKGSFEYAGRKGASIHNKVDAGLYANFINAIEQERLISPKNNNASYWLEQLLAKTSDQLVRADLTDQLIAALCNKGQHPINYFSQGLNEAPKYNYEYFMDGANHFKAALKYLQNNREMYELTNASRLFLEAKALEQSKDARDWEYALKLSDSSLAIYDWAYTYHTKALLFANLNNIDSMLAIERKAISIAPVWSGAYAELGKGYAAKQQPDTAIFYLKKSVQLNPANENAYSNLGAVYHKMKRMDTSMYYSRKGIALNPENAKAYNNLGLVYEDFKQSDSAIAYYKKAILLNPRNEIPCFNLGNVFSAMNKYDTAIAYYKKAIALNPAFVDAYSNLGLAYYRLRQYDNAIAQYIKVTELSPRPANAYYMLVCCYSLKKDKSAALKYVETSLQKGANNFKAADKDPDLEYIRKQKDFDLLRARYASGIEKK